MRKLTAIILVAMSIGSWADCLFTVCSNHVSVVTASTQPAKWGDDSNYYRNTRDRVGSLEDVWIIFTESGTICYVLGDSRLSAGALIDEFANVWGMPENTTEEKVTGTFANSKTTHYKHLWRSQQTPPAIGLVRVSYDREDEANPDVSFTFNNKGC